MVGSSICLNSVPVRLPAVGKPALAWAAGRSPWPRPGSPRLAGRPSHSLLTGQHLR